MERLKESQEFSAAAMISSQEKMEDQANRKRDPAPLFRIGDKVWLNLKKSKLHSLKKFSLGKPKI